MVGIMLGMVAVAVLIAVPILGDAGVLALRAGLTMAVGSLFLVVTAFVLKDAKGIKRGE